MKPGNLKPLENEEIVPFLHNSRQVEATSAVTFGANNQGTLMLGGHETWEFETSLMVTEPSNTSSTINQGKSVPSATLRTFCWV